MLHSNNLERQKFNYTTSYMSNFYYDIFSCDQKKICLFVTGLNKNSSSDLIGHLDNGQSACRGYFQTVVVDETHIPQFADVVVGHSPADPHFN